MVIQYREYLSKKDTHKLRFAGNPSGYLVMPKRNQHTANEYISRINKVFDYIEKHFDKQFTLEELANVALFSKYHFNRIFQGVVGETPFQFINRVRLEKAAYLISINPTESITGIANKCGFPDSAVFSRNFKKHFNKTPTCYRKENSNISQVNSKLLQTGKKSFAYFCYETNSMKWKTNFELNKGVEVVTIPTKTVAYVRHVGAYKGDGDLFHGLWNRLFTWAGSRGLIGGRSFESLTVYHDSPNITEEAKLRTSICITIPPETEVDGIIGKMNIQGGKYAICHFELTESSDFEKAWEWVFGHWFPDSGYQPDDLPCFEIYPKSPVKRKINVDICVAVKPL